MPDPFILVVTATLGNRKSLARTVKSVAEIGGANVKHVLIAPKEEIQHLGESHPQLEILEEPGHVKGIYAALNYALLKYAPNFEYLTFINDDDFWLPAYRNLIDLVLSNKTVDVAYGRVLYYNESANVISKQTCSPSYENFEALFFSDVILFTQQSTLIKSELFTDLNGFDESYKLVADTDFWIRAIKKRAVFEYVNAFCAGYTLQVGQLSSDGSLQDAEHELLKSRLKKPGFSKRIVVLLVFRLRNMSIYINRLIAGTKSMKTIFRSGN
ncbi:hypothetical protein [Leeuwenhoekiella sp. H156]|uniref:hypothetical protein n=1 Tax=Leeuwenhoekiella sp. H156 TaxID=3450128 RepID=UPI003FA44C63